MLIATTEKIPGTEYEVLGLVKGSTVQCKNIGRDIGSCIQKSDRWRNGFLFRNAK